MKILSISDLITNSSSEVFCYIRHLDPQVTQEIFDVFNDIFGYNQEYEITPVVDRTSDNEVTIDIPYCLANYAEFFKAGIEAIMKESFTDYKIIYT